MAEDVTTLTYPVETSADQLTGGSAFTVVGDPATWEGWVPGTGAVVLSDAADATRDPGNQYECQLADGTDQGFTDTTYTLTASQIAAGSLMGA
jgi:hypothetical protein